jgi:hypothetical protein
MAKTKTEPMFELSESELADKSASLAELTLEYNRIKQEKKHAASTFIGNMKRVKTKIDKLAQMIIDHE